MGKFVVSKRTNGQFQFNLKADNEEIILTSEGYAARPGCSNGVDAVKEQATYKENFEEKTASNGKHYFVIIAGNGEIIGTSQMYESKAGMLKGIESVMKNAPKAEVMAEM